MDRCKQKNYRAFYSGEALMFKYFIKQFLIYLILIIALVSSTLNNTFRDKDGVANKATTTFVYQGF